VKAKFNKAGVAKRIRRIALARLETVGQFVRTEAINRAPKDLGDLVRSISYEVFPDKLSVRIGSNLVYAAIQEFGGVITPDKAGALTIPVHPDAKGKRASDFPDLIFIKREGANPLLVRKSGGPRSEKFDIMFVLVKSAEIPAHPYLRPALLENKNQLLKIMQLKRQF